MNKDYYSYAENGRLVLNNKGTTDFVETNKQSGTNDFENDAPLYCQDYENKEKVIYNSESNLKLN